MNVYFAGHAGFHVYVPKEYALKSRGAKRLISYGDPSKDKLIEYWRTPNEGTPVRSPRRRLR